jgi:hypothetical protein
VHLVVDDERRMLVVMGSTICAAVVLALVTAPGGPRPGHAAPARSTDIHPGVGYLVSLARDPVTPHGTRTARRPPPPRSLSLTPTTTRPRPALERTGLSRRGQAALLGTAIAVQAGMIVYGIATMLARQAEAKREQERLYGDIPQWDPYPR